jgi:hypothetical protein
MILSPRTYSNLSGGCPRDRCRDTRSQNDVHSNQLQDLFRFHNRELVRRSQQLARRNKPLFSSPILHIACPNGATDENIQHHGAALWAMEGHIRAKKLFRMLEKSSATYRD